MATKPPPTPPEVDPAYSGLSLDDLRDLRRELGDEESRVSYWRRIIQARIDLLTRGSSDGDIVERLTSVLAESGAVHRRLANLSVKPAGDIEALPDLHGLWTRVVDSRDAAAVAALLGLGFGVIAFALLTGLAVLKWPWIGAAAVLVRGHAGGPRRQGGEAGDGSFARQRAGAGSFYPIQGAGRKGGFRKGSAP